MMQVETNKKYSQINDYTSNVRPFLPAFQDSYHINYKQIGLKTY